MPPNIKVCVNGFVLSTLLFDCANNSGDQEGFLYGSVARNVRREISDQSLTNTQEEILISICSSVPCGSFLSFYDNLGHIKDEELEFNLGDRKQNIIGWYRYRRYSAMYPSAREIIVHRNLRNLFSADSDSGHSYFVYAILSSSNLPNFATHSYDYAFFSQKRDNSFKSLSTTILNLGDTRNSYRQGSLALPFMNSTSFTSVLSASWNFGSFYAIEDQIQQFHQELRVKLESLQEELAASDAVNATLEDDIHRLSNQMQALLASQEAYAAHPSHSTAAEVAVPVESSALGSSANVQADRELKRLADIPLEADKPNKRTCIEKEYFEGDEDEGEVATEKVTSDSTATTSTQGVYASISSTGLLSVDSDICEASCSHADKTFVKPDVTAREKDMNLVPSPSSTVEVVISDAGAESSFEGGDHEDFGSSDIDGSQEPRGSTEEELDSSSLTEQENTTVDVEFHDEASSSAVHESSSGSATSVSTTVMARPSSTSEDFTKKMTPPFIIYASKDSRDQGKDSAASSSFEESQEFVETLPEASSESKPFSPIEEVEPESSSPTSTIDGHLNEKEKDQSGAEKKVG